MKYPWFDRLITQRDSALAAPLIDRLNAYEWAEYFIEEWADVAERHGWQPAHLMRYATGLAWRAYERPVRYFQGRCCILAGPSFHMPYEAKKDGSIRRVEGRARMGVLGAAGLPSAVQHG